MTNGITPEERQALLAEYQVCEQDNAANFQGFWTLAAIFLGLSSAFLAGLIYAVIANKTLIDTMLTGDDPRKTLVIGIMALIIGIANVIILRKIKGWHRRVLQNQAINSGRMREIELQLGMNRSYRTFALDRWYKIPKKNRNWNELKKKLQEEEGIDPKNLENLKEEICQLIKRYPSQKEQGKRKYEPPSSRRHFPCILYTLMSLWGLVIIAGISLIAIAICIANNP